LNLLFNAINYSPEHTTITMRLSDNSKFGILEVKDEGIGIAKEEIPRVFERFYRVDKARSREHGGTGLGLSIVKMLIDKYDGTLEVSSALNEGTTFTIHLPLFLVQESI